MTTLITDHVARALANLLPEWRDDDRTREIAAAFVEEIQEIEDVLYQLVVDRYLSTAEGVQLDAYGELLSVERNGLDDDQYRGVLQVKPLVNRAPGVADSVTRVAEIVFFSARPVRYQQEQPASYLLTLSAGLTGAEIHTQANAASIDNEANATTGWTGIDAILTSSAERPYLGEYAIHADAPGSGTAFVEYTFASVVDEVYRVAFAARRLGETLDQRIEGWTGVAISPDQPIDSSEWKEYEFFVTATGVSITVSIAATIGALTTGPFVALDAVSVRPVVPLSPVLIEQGTRLLLEATPAGVGLNGIVNAPVDHPFRFDSATGENGYDIGRYASLLGT